MLPPAGETHENTPVETWDFATDGRPLRFAVVHAPEGTPPEDTLALASDLTPQPFDHVVVLPHGWTFEVVEAAPALCEGLPFFAADHPNNPSDDTP